MAEDPTWEGVGEGLLILLAVWWAWAGYSWLTNLIDTDENVNRLCMLAAMGAMLIVSLAIPEAFGDEGLLFGLAYFVVRVLQLVLYLRNARRDHDDDNFAAFARIAPGFLIGSTLLIVAGLLDGGARTSLWIIALAIDVGTPALRGASSFHIKPGHFAERYGLIVIIALGESIVAVGSGAGLELTARRGHRRGCWRSRRSRPCGGPISTSSPWSPSGACARPSPRSRRSLARDSYTYLHYPMIAGIVLLALGLKKVLGDVEEPLKDVGAVALCGGAALYLLGHIAFRLPQRAHAERPPQRRDLPAARADPARARGRRGRSRSPLSARSSSGLIAYEAIHFRDARARVRANPDATLAEMRGRPL